MKYLNNLKRNFFEELRKELGYRSDHYEDWYNIRSKDIGDFGGGYLLQTYYSGSPYQALKSIYPNYSWIPWKFVQVKSNWIEILPF